jgi:hypothetical protein
MKRDHIRDAIVERIVTRYEKSMGLDAVIELLESALEDLKELQRFRKSEKPDVIN